MTNDSCNICTHLSVCRFIDDYIYSISNIDISVTLDIIHVSCKHFLFNGDDYMNELCKGDHE